MRLRLDRTTQRFGTTLLGGSPTTLLRLTDAGTRVLDALQRGEPIAPSHLRTRLLATGLAHPMLRLAGDADIEPDIDPDVTTVIPARDHPPLIDVQRGGVVLIDDGSNPPLADATERHDVSRGPAAARNRGLAHVHSVLVAFVDTDTIVTDDWVDRLAGHFDDPPVAAVAPRVRSRIGPSILERYERARSPLDLGPHPARVRPGGSVSYVPSAALVVRTDVLRELGGFDESLRYGEDVDLVWRLVAAGHTVRYEPTVEVEHVARATWSEWIAQRVSYGSSAAPLAQRHRGALAPIVLSPWSAAVWVLVVAGRPVAAGLAAAGTAALLAWRLDTVPTAAATHLALAGHMATGRHLAEAIRRAWLPLIAMAGVPSRRARWVLGAAMAAALWDEPSTLPRAGQAALRVVDDAAYCAGVWKGCWRERTLAPLLPGVSTARSPRRRSGTARSAGPRRRRPAVRSGTS